MSVYEDNDILMHYPKARKAIGKLLLAGRDRGFVEVRMEGNNIAVADHLRLFECVAKENEDNEEQGK